MLQVPLVNEGGTLKKDYLEWMEKGESLEQMKKAADQNVEGYSWVEGILKREVTDELNQPRQIVVVPKGLRRRLLKMAHDEAGHLSVRKVMFLLCQSYMWPRMKHDVSQYCRLCVKCQRFRKVGVSRVPLQPVPVFSVPFEHVAIDLVGPFERSKDGYKVLLTFICLASRYPEALPLKSATAEEVVEGLLEIFSRTGVPKTLLSDQGRQFTGSLVSILCKRLNVEKILTTPYHPQSNGCVERIYGTLVPMIRKSLQEKLQWSKQLKFCLFALRSVPNRATGFLLFEVVDGRNIRSPLELVADELDGNATRSVKELEWLEKLHIRMAVIREKVLTNARRAKEATRQAFDKTATTREIKEGTMVLLWTPGLTGKLEESWEGPYEVLKQKNEVNLELGIPGAKNRGKGKTVHFNNVKPFIQEEVAVLRLVVAAEGEE